MSKQSDYLWDQICNHSSLFFSREANGALRSAKVIFTSYSDASGLRENAIAIPIDILLSPNPVDLYTVSFNDTHVTIWNRIPKPDGDGWRSIPDDEKPLWYRHDKGTLIPAWDLFGNLFNLLTLREETESKSRDGHGRFVAEFSPRAKNDLIEVPAFNEAVAVLVDAAISMQKRRLPALDVRDCIRPPVIVLSHDCDVLLGNDFWTQSIRAYRIFRPLLSAKLPKLQNIWWMLRNYTSPRSFYFDNVIGMINVERLFGYRSAFYMINGKGGRFGARSGSKIIRELVPSISDGWDIGIHYNYNTYLDDRKFIEQKEELETITKGRVASGRAHYLRFDPEKSFSFLAKNNIEVDESVGYSDRIGYRSGIGGCFQPFDSISKKAMDIYEVPMVVMEGTLFKQYGSDSMVVFERILCHLKSIGGALSLVVHPGVFFNPEFSEAVDFYQGALNICRKMGAVSETASSLTRRLQHESN